MCHGRMRKRTQNGCRSKPVNVIGCLPRRSGNTQRVRGAKTHTGGVRILAKGRRTAMVAAVSGTTSRPAQLAHLRRMVLACSTQRAMYGNGSKTAGMRITTERRGMGEHGKKRTAENAASVCSGAAPGSTLRGTCDHRSGSGLDADGGDSRHRLSSCPGLKLTLCSLSFYPLRRRSRRRIF